MIPAAEMSLERLAEPMLELGPHASEATGAAEDRRLALRRDEDGVAWLLLDRAGSTVNAFDAAFFEALDGLLDELGRAPAKALVLRSAKPSGFAVGADIDEFRGLADPAEAVRRIEAANRVVDRLATLSRRTIAIIHGACAGGGVELALACDRRLAVANARLSLPEIKLGLHPGLGGTARLSHLIDPIEALTLMLTGREIDAEKAERLGLVDAVIEERHVANAVRAAVAGEVEGADSGLRATALRAAPARRFAARRMREKADGKASPEHYPAPRALIALWEEHGGDRDAMLEAERASFAGLVTGATAQALFRVFDLRGRLKRFGRAASHRIGHVHVVGAGAMGAEIAAWCALNGFRATVTDPDMKALGAGYASACSLFEKEIARGADQLAARDRLIWDPSGDGAAKADLVIEAAPETLALKREIYADLERRMKPEALLATNTSSLPLSELAGALGRPERFVGLHFFNPVAKMPLVEVARSDATQADAHARALAFATALGKLPAPVTDSPGFLVNRVLTPYLLEGLALLDEGAPKERIDAAAERFGMPMGPIELADQVGLDVCLDVSRNLRASVGEEWPEVPGWLAAKVEKGELGRKSGAGLYRYRNGEPQKEDTEPPEEAAAEALRDRLVLPMLNAAVACLRAGVVEDPDIADAAMIFGAGFPPFRGGPIAYARARGPEQIVQRLRAFAAEHGRRFEPDPGWAEIAPDG